MKRILFGVALLIWSAAVWSGTPCCTVAVIDAKTGVVSVKDVKTGKVIQYKAEPVGIKKMKVGQKVDLVEGQLRTAAGVAIAGQVQPSGPVSKSLRRLTGTKCEPPMVKCPTGECASWCTGVSKPSSAGILNSDSRMPASGGPAQTQDAQTQDAQTKAARDKKVWEYIKKNGLQDKAKKS